MVFSRTTPLLVLAAVAGSLALPGPAAAQAPAPDVVKPVFSWTPNPALPFQVGSCGFAQTRKVYSEVFLNLSEAAKLEVVSVHKGATRRTTLSFSSGTGNPTGLGTGGAPVTLPTSLIGAAGGNAVITGTPVDLAGNRGEPKTISIPVKSIPYTFFCSGIPF